MAITKWHKKCHKSHTILAKKKKITQNDINFRNFIIFQENMKIEKIVEEKVDS